MGFVFGTAAELSMDPAGGTSYTVTLDCAMNELSLERELDEAEVTTFCSTIKDYIPGLAETTLEFEGLYQDGATEVDFQLNNIFGSATIPTWRYRPAGTGSNLPEYTFAGFLQEYTIEATIDEAVTIEGTIRVTNSVVRSVQP